MFGIGTGELLLLLVIALIVLGPERMPKVARDLGRMVGDLRRTFDLDAVAVLRPEGGGWTTVAAAGGPVPARPQDAAFSAQLAEGTVLGGSRSAGMIFASSTGSTSWSVAATAMSWRSTEEIVRCPPPLKRRWGM